MSGLGAGDLDLLVVMVKHGGADAVEDFGKPFAHVGILAGLAHHQTGNGPVGKANSRNGSLDFGRVRRLGGNGLGEDLNRLRLVQIIDHVQGVTGVTENQTAADNRVVCPGMVRRDFRRDLPNRHERFLDQFLDFHHRRGEAEFVVDGQSDSGRVGGAGDLAAFVSGHSHWFFQQDVLAGGSGGDGEGGVGVVVGADHYGVDVGVGEGLLRFAGCGFDSEFPLECGGGFGSLVYQDLYGRLVHFG